MSKQCTAKLRLIGRHHFLGLFASFWLREVEGGGSGNHGDVKRELAVCGNRGEVAGWGPLLCGAEGKVCAPPVSPQGTVSNRREHHLRALSLSLLILGGERRGITGKPSCLLLPLLFF